MNSITHEKAAEDYTKAAEDLLLKAAQARIKAANAKLTEKQIAEVEEQIKLAAATKILLQNILVTLQGVNAPMVFRYLIAERVETLRPLAQHHGFDLISNGQPGAYVLAAKQ